MQPRRRRSVGHITERWSDHHREYEPARILITDFTISNLGIDDKGGGEPDVTKSRQMSPQMTSLRT